MARSPRMDAPGRFHNVFNRAATLAIQQDPNDRFLVDIQSKYMGADFLDRVGESLHGLLLCVLT